MELNPTTYDNEALIKAIYDGVYSSIILPDSLYEFHYLNLMSGVGIGFGMPELFDKGIRFDTVTKFKRNISEFAGSKSFQQTATLVDSMFTLDGKRIPFSDFKNIASGVMDDFNVNWLKTELNTSLSLAQNAEKWVQIEEEADIFPFLEYRTIGDGRVRPEHASWNGIVKRVDDPFWDDKYPPNDYNCRCEVIQRREAQPTKKTGDKNTAEAFKNNPAKSGMIYDKSHPYFDVPSQYKGAQKVNFGFTTPDDKEVFKTMKKVK